MATHEEMMGLSAANIVEGGKVVGAALKHRAAIADGLRRLFHELKSGRQRVLVTGAAGVGKSTVSKLLAGVLTNEDVLKGYRESVVVETHRIKPSALDLSDTPVPKFLVAPGQGRRTREPRSYEWPKIREAMRQGRVIGIINVVADGHHTTFGTAPSGIGVPPGGPAATADYLDAQRKMEIENLKGLADDIVDIPNSLWFVTLIAKQDLWWRRRDEVEHRYRTGDYNDTVESIIARRAEAGRAMVGHLCACAATWENLTIPHLNVEVLVNEGYDLRIRTAYTYSFAQILGQLVGGGR